VLVVVLENPDRFAIRLTEQISSIGLFAVTESQCTEDEDDAKFRNLGLRIEDDLPAAGRAGFLLPEQPHKLFLDILLRHLHIGFDRVEDR
jgi:hypothetical protein